MIDAHTQTTNDSSPVVTIPKLGAVRGLLNKDMDNKVTKFLNVPFAVVEGRWRPATKVRSWDGIRDATKFGLVIRLFFFVNLAESERTTVFCCLGKKLTSYFVSFRLRHQKSPFHSLSLSPSLNSFTLLPHLFFFLDIDLSMCCTVDQCLLRRPRTTHSCHCSWEFRKSLSSTRIWASAIAWIVTSTCQPQLLGTRRRRRNCQSWCGFMAVECATVLTLFLCMVCFLSLYIYIVNIVNLRLVHFFLLCM